MIIDYLFEVEPALKKWGPHPLNNFNKSQENEQTLASIKLYIKENACYSFHVKNKYVLKDKIYE
jgi:hypothetical protein